MSSRKAAVSVGIFTAFAHFILNTLIKKVLIKVKDSDKAHIRDKFVHLLTPKGIREKSILTHDFIRAKNKAYKSLRNEIDIHEREVKVGMSVFPKSSNIKKNELNLF